MDTVYVTLTDQANAATVQARIADALDVLGPGYRVLTRNDPAAGFNVNVVLFPLLAIFALIGMTGLWLLFAWLLSAAIGAWVTERKGYGERVGLAFGLLLTVAGLLIVLLLPGRPGSRWKLEGPLPKRTARR